MPSGGSEKPRKWDNAIWRLLLFAKKFQFNSIHTAQNTPIKLAELVRYSNSDSDLRRMTDFIRRDDKHYNMSIWVKHDMGKRSYYTSTIVIGTIENRSDGETVITGTARFGSTYLATVLGISVFCSGMVIGTVAEPIVAMLWAILLLFMLSHIRQMFVDRNQIIRLMHNKCQQPLLTQAEREATAGEWQSISRYAEGNFYNSQSR